METYYKPEHLAKFEEIGKELSGLAEKFFDYYNAVFQSEMPGPPERGSPIIVADHCYTCTAGAGFT